MTPSGTLRNDSFRHGAIGRSCQASAAIIAVALITLVALPAFAGDAPTLKVGGLLFGDAYYVASHHNPDDDGAAGLVLRRGYLTLNSTFGKTWFARARYEVNQSGKFEEYDLDGQVKDLYAGLKVGHQKLTFGLQPTITYDLIESAWGMRYLARTPLDLHGVASRDTGVSASGPMNGSGTLSYRAMVGIDVTFEADSNESSKLMGALTWKPAPAWTVDLYADFEDRIGPNDRTTFQLFAAHKTDTLRWGVQYSNQDRKNDPPLELASAFVVSRMSERMSLVGRVDRLMEPSPKGNGISYLPFDPTAKATMVIAGVEFRVTPHVALTPNTVVTFYDRNDQGVRPDTDVHLRLTCFVNFE